MGAAWLYQWWSRGTGHHCPMAPSVFWGGLGSPLAGHTGPGLAVGPQDPSGGGGNKGLLYPGASPQIKVQSGSIWRDWLGRAYASSGGRWERSAPGLGAISGGGKKESPSLLPRPRPGQNTAGASQAGPSQGRLTLTPFLRARPLNAPALTWRPTVGQRPKVDMLGRAGMCHYFGWLGTMVLLAVGSMKECMGVTTLA